MNYRTILIFPIIFVLVQSCSHDVNKNKIDENKNLEECIKGFNEIFEYIDFDGNHYQFTNIKIDKHNINLDFYSSIDLLNLKFIELSNDSIQFNLAVDLSKKEGRHQFYFCTKLNEFDYIDFSSSVLTNLNFLNYCDIKIRESNLEVKPLFTSNLSDSRFFGNWIVESEYDNDSTIKEIIVKDDKTLYYDNVYVENYQKNGNKLFDESSQKLIFEIVALSSKSLIIQFPKDQRKISYTKIDYVTD